MMKIGIMKNVGLALLLATVAGVSNAAIVRTYTALDGSGQVTFTALAGNQLEIKIDNTSDNNVVGSAPGFPSDPTYMNSSVITGLVFDITETVTAATMLSFEDGLGADLSTLWDFSMNVDNNITPGNTVVDMSFTTLGGINGGIYNADKPGSDLNNVAPDIATIILQIDSPNPWNLTGIENDILRMQRVGPSGEGSLKIPGVPVPAAVWLFGSGLLGLVAVSRRKAR